MQIRIAKLEHKQLHYKETLQALEPLLKEEPEDSLDFEALFLKSLAMMGMDQCAEAMESFERVSEKAPSKQMRAEAAYLRGYCAVLLMKYGLAEGILRDFIEQYPRHPNVHKARDYLKQITPGN